MPVKPYHQVPIQDCGEPLVSIPAGVFVLPSEHPYGAVGAPYGGRSPYCLRAGVLQRLHQAQGVLQSSHPGWRILIFDAYRPIAVQQYMVDYTFAELVRSRQLSPTSLTPAQHIAFMEQVHQFWAAPSLDPATPPPHSTGAAIDVTLANPSGTAVDMGSPIDELSPRSYPDHFAAVADPDSPGYDGAGAIAHQHRQRLRRTMEQAGFCGHPKEWWHFSYGDQMWVWHRQQSSASQSSASQSSAINPEIAFARYGAVSA